MNFERVHVELTNKCNFDCEFCPNSVMSRERGEMDPSVYAAIVDEISTERLADTILLHVMGEPLMCGFLAGAIGLARQKGLKVCLTTNGALMRGEILKSVIKSDVEHIILSVQTPAAGSFEARMSGMPFGDYFEVITSAVAAILNARSKTKITLSFLTTPFKSHLAPSFKKSIIDSRGELAELCYPWVEAIAKKTDRQDVRSDIEKRLQSLRGDLGRMSLLGWNQLKISESLILETRVLGDWVRSGHIKEAVFGCCEGLTKHFGILWNGDMVFCCVDFDGKTAFGNVKNVSMKEAFRGSNVQGVIDGFRSFRVLHPHCKRCLGDRSIFRSVIRQIGSIFYFKLYRRWWKKKRIHV